MKPFSIQYNLTKIILQSVADHNCELRSTTVYFAVQRLKQATRPSIGLSLFVLSRHIRALSFAE